MKGHSKLMESRTSGPLVTPYDLNIDQRTCFGQTWTRVKRMGCERWLPQTLPPFLGLEAL
jgi:hypothetical protein